MGDNIVTVTEFNNEEVLKRKIKIEEAQRLYNSQKRIADDAIVLSRLAEENLCSAIKSDLSIYDYASEQINKVFEEKEITDKRRKRHNIEWLESKISEDFFNNGICQIVDIYWLGIEHEAIMVYVRYENKNYCVTIPLKRNLGWKFDEHSYGRFSVDLCTSSSTREQLFSSYLISDVAAYMKNYLSDDKE